LRWIGIECCSLVERSCSCCFSHTSLPLAASCLGNDRWKHNRSRNHNYWMVPAAAIAQGHNLKLHLLDRLGIARIRRGRYEDCVRQPFSCSIPFDVCRHRSGWQSSPMIASQDRTCSQTGYWQLSCSPRPKKSCARERRCGVPGPPQWDAGSMIGLRLPSMMKHRSSELGTSTLHVAQPGLPSVAN